MVGLGVIAHSQQRNSILRLCGFLMLSMIHGGSFELL